MALKDNVFSNQVITVSDDIKVPSADGNTTGYMLCLALLDYIRGRINKSDVGLSNVPNTDFTNRVETIEGKIPSQASSSNKLADKDYVNSSISTNTAEFRGTYASLTELKAITNADINDYAFYVRKDDDGNTLYDRYKYTSGSDPWEYEYTLNNSSLTAAQWAALNSGITEALRKAYDAHIASKANPHGVTKAQVGLGNVDNTSDKDKPISDAALTALNGKAATKHTHVKEDITDFPTSMPASDVSAWAKASSKPSYSVSEITGLSDDLAEKVDKETGKGLSTNDYTTTEKNKLAGIAEGANKTVVDSALSSTSENPVQNKVINSAISGLRKIKITQTTILDTTSFEGTVTLSQSLLNFDFILFGVRYNGGAYQLQPVFAPSSVLLDRFGTATNRVVLSTDAQYCSFYFPSATSISLYNSNLGDKSNKQVYIIGIKLGIG